MVEINARHRGNAENYITEIREHLFLSFPCNGKSCSFDAGEKKPEILLDKTPQTKNKSFPGRLLFRLGTVM